MGSGFCWRQTEPERSRSKRPREGEPVLLPETGLVLCVYGLDGVGQPIKEVCCRVEEVCAILGKEEKDVLTAADLAKLAASPAGGKKVVRAGMAYAVLFNKADTRERKAAALKPRKRLQVRKRGFSWRRI